VSGRVIACLLVAAATIALLACLGVLLALALTGYPQ
jgi:hypothetical protein